MTRDPKRAAELYERACKDGDGSGCSYSGDLYLNGNGVTKNEKRAAEFYQGACEANDARSCKNLGTLYEGQRSRKRHAPCCRIVGDLSSLAKLSQAC